MATLKNKKGYLALIYIEWCDASAFSSQWVDIKTALEWGESEDWLIRQSGFLLEENKEYILLASRVNPENIQEIKVDGLFKIPKTWIRKKTILAKIKII